jgi:hypothetical protein
MNMKYLIIVLLLPFLSIAQSVTIIPGGQSINGDSAFANQLEVNGNGLLVQAKSQLASGEPESDIAHMQCPNRQAYSDFGTITDPNGTGKYTAGIIYNCSNSYLANYTNEFIGYKIKIIELDLEVNGDTLYISDAFNKIALTGQLQSPTEYIFNGEVITFQFKTDGDANVGTGFKISYQKIQNIISNESIKNYFGGNGMLFNTKTGSLFAGKNSVQNVENFGFSSIGTGLYTKPYGNYSFAGGAFSEARGSYSTSFGYSSIAIGSSSTSTGSSTKAIGNSSFTSGIGSNAMADGSSSFGWSTIAKSRFSTVIGSYNDISDNPYYPTSEYNYYWFPTDRIFQIGIGYDEASRKNALTVLLNGNTGIGILEPSSKLEVDGEIKSTELDFTGTTQKRPVYADKDGILRIENSSNQYYSVNFSAAQTQNPTDDIRRGSGYAWFNTTNAAKTLYIPINLPQGVLVTNVRVYVLDNSDNNISYIFNKNSHTTNTFTEIASAESSGSNATIRSINDTAQETINNLDNSYYINISSVGNWTGNSLLFHSLVITYQYQ